MSTTERPSRISRPFRLHAPRGRTASQAGPRQTPVVLGAFRAGELILAQVMAFGVDKGRLITEGEGRRWTRSGRANINRSTLLR